MSNNKKINEIAEKKGAETEVVKPPVPYMYHEMALTREERHTFRAWLIAIIEAAMIVALIVSFVIYNHCKDKMWLDYLSQYDFESYEVTSDSGNANYIGNDGDIYNGDGQGTKKN